MPSFAYQLRDAAGRSSNGVLNATDRTEASRLLRRDGHVVVALHEAGSGAVPGDAPVASPSAKKKRIKKDDIIYFTTQLAVMVDTGVPLPEALDAIANQCDHPSLKKVVEDLSEQVKGGVEFSMALQSYPKLFNNLFVALMRASEASGTMGQMLQRVSEYMEQERDTRKQVKGALTYPACMLTFCILVVVAMMLFILPRFEKIYSGKGAVLPLPTRILLGASNALISYWPVVVAGLLGAIVGGWFYLRTPAGKMKLDAVRIHLPILGSMYRKSYLARSLRTMATMVTTGVSMLDGLAITAQVAGNHYYAQIWTRLADAVKQGSTLSEELFECELMPRTISQMVAAGEKTGQLSMVMNRVAKFCEDDLRVSVKTVTTMIEPMMIIVMGMVIGGIAMALLLPVFSISKVVAH